MAPLTVELFLIIAVVNMAVMLQGERQLYLQLSAWSSRVE